AGGLRPPRGGTTIASAMDFAPRDGLSSPRFSQVATFMRLPHVRDLASGLEVAIAGVPYDGSTSFRPGARLGPRAIRNESALARPFNPALKVRPFDVLKVADYGDIDIAPNSIERTYQLIQAEVRRLVEAGVFPLLVGGDHSITLAHLREIARRHGPLAVLHLDSHLDTWDEYFGSKYFHGTPFRRGVEEGVIDPKHFVQLGIRGSIYDERDLDFQRQHGIEVIRIEEVEALGVGGCLERLGRLKGRPLFVSFDIDVVDPAYAPGTGTPEVGGLTSRQALALVRGLVGFDLVGFDLVEVSPLYDGPGQVTALLAANLLYETLGVLALNKEAGLARWARKGAR
ncbi:MAG TPA: agmatinase, partial [Thermodesulfobacteriota bacterium]|nr:agmatinase [Thermodesulfobacteriota bacterium]